MEEQEETRTAKEGGTRYGEAEMNLSLTGRRDGVDAPPSQRGHESPRVSRVQPR